MVYSCRSDDDCCITIGPDLISVVHASEPLSNKGKFINFPTKADGIRSSRVSDCMLLHEFMKGNILTSFGGVELKNFHLVLIVTQVMSDASSNMGQGFKFSGLLDYFIFYL